MTRRVGRWSCCRFVRLRWGSTASRQVVWGQHHQSWFVSIVITPLGAQISPSKNVNFQCASAAFTLPPEPMGFVVMCQLAPQAGPLLCGFCPSPRTFALRLPSDNPSRSCPCLRLVVNLLYVSITVLPQGTFTPSVHAHVGRTPFVPADCLRQPLNLNVRHQWGRSRYSYFLRLRLPHINFGYLFACFARRNMKSGSSGSSLHLSGLFLPSVQLRCTLCCGRTGDLHTNQ